MSKSKELLKRFENPGSEYRGKPFWAWNGKLDAEELRRQLRLMKRMGLGGAFMHSRVGLATPYLSDEWFSMIGHCIDECKKIGMEAWLYDEDRWPSGAAGGIVTKNPRYRQTYLAAAVVQPGASYTIEGKLLRSYAAVVHEDTLRSPEPVKVPAKGTWRGKKQLVLLAVNQPLGEDWFNGYTYLDTMNHEAVRKFIEVTHEQYRKRFGKDFGKVVPGIFTDEPNYGSALAGYTSSWALETTYSVPWTASLPKTFKKRYGYDILDNLLEIFFDVDGRALTPARHDYHDCITFLFVDAFSRQCGEWCGRYSLPFTGHVLCEETPVSQTGFVGSAMRFYEHMQIPGIDILVQIVPEYDTAKQCQSVARQMGRKWVLSELYGCTGWDFTFEGHKAYGDWQAALGINLRCQHLSWFTMAGEAKRDYPASMLHQSPWWQMYPKVEDYYARLGVILTAGEAVCDILVVHPIESTWVRCKVGWHKDPQVAWLEGNLKNIRNWLLEAQLDFDYGDEEMMSRLASVSRRGASPVVKLGKSAYTTVVVPPMITIRKSTVKLLEKFIAAGGKVIFAGPIAQHVDAEKSDLARRAAKGAKKVAFSRAAVVKAVEQAARVIRLTDGKGRPVRTAFYQLRRDRTGRYLFICNTDRNRGYPVVDVEIDAKYAEEWDADTAQRFAAKCSHRGNRLVVRTSLPPTGSRVFFFPHKKDASLKPRPEYREVRSLPLPKKWSIQLTEPNALVLDRAMWRIDDGKWNGPEEILRVDKAVREQMGLPQRGGRMKQPWAQPLEPRPKTASLELAYTFHVEKLPSGQLQLAVENPEHFSIALNGIEISVDDDSGWWVDKSLRRLELPTGALKVGENSLTVLCPGFHRCVDLEEMFILGDFGVKVEGTDLTMVEPTTELRVGDWVGQSLPFYSASVVYHTILDASLAEGERAILSLPDWKGTCVVVRAGGKQVGCLAWPPYEIDVTDALAGGPVDLGIEVVGSRRNAFGPLHQVPPEAAWVGPDQFRTEGKQWQEGYNLKPCGLLKQPVLKIVR